MLGKEYAKDQERRLTMDLTKLKNDAASVTNPPSLLEQSVVEMIRYSLLRDLLVLICGYV